MTAILSLHSLSRLLLRLSLVDSSSQRFIYRTLMRDEIVELLRRHVMDGEATAIHEIDEGLLPNTLSERVMKSLNDFVRSSRWHADTTPRADRQVDPLFLQCRHVGKRGTAFVGHHCDDLQLTCLNIGSDLRRTGDEGIDVSAKNRLQCR